MFERIRQLYLQNKMTETHLENAVKKKLITKKQNTELINLKKKLQSEK